MTIMVRPRKISTEATRGDLRVVGVSMAICCGAVAITLVGS
jgi:hypothetical protein